MTSQICLTCLKVFKKLRYKGAEKTHLSLNRVFLRPGEQGEARTRGKGTLLKIFLLKLIDFFRVHIAASFRVEG